MYLEKANTLCHNVAFSRRIIVPMKREIHPQMQRLYRAAEELAQVKNKAGLARLLNQKDQTINNWEDRGISDPGLLLAQEKIGCDAIWVRDGVGEMVRQVGKAPPASLDDVAHLILVYGKLPEKQRQLTLDFAESMLELAGSGKIAAGDQS